MKTTRLLLVLTLTLAGTLPIAAFDKHGPRVEVNYFEPTQFTDVRDSYPEGTEKGREATLAELRSHLLRRLSRIVPAGQRLSITITDVDLAGDYEPWHGPRWADVRIVKDLYPPSIKLNFQLVDADGNVVKSGKRELPRRSAAPRKGAARRLDGQRVPRREMSGGARRAREAGTAEARCPSHEQSVDEASRHV